MSAPESDDLAEDRGERMGELTAALQLRRDADSAVTAVLARFWPPGTAVDYRISGVSMSAEVTGRQHDRLLARDDTHGRVVSVYAEDITG